MHRRHLTATNAPSASGRLARYDSEKRVLAIGGLALTVSLFAYLAALAI